MPAPKGNKYAAAKNKGGRPRVALVEKNPLPEKEIVLDQVLYWIDLQATAEEIAGSFYVSTSTLDRRLKEHFGYGFEELKKKCSGSAKLSLRRYQFQQAEKNTTMSIWLGKIWLGQSDKDEVKELAHDVIKQAVRELQTERGIQAISRPALADESSVLDQRPPGKSGEVQNELGTEHPLERSTSLQNHSESSPARNDNVFLPPFS